MNYSKYHAKKVTVDGIVFDSRKEANRFCELKWLERAGKIKNLQRQVKFELTPAFKDHTGKVFENQAAIQLILSMMRFYLWVRRGRLSRMSKATVQRNTYSNAK